MKVFLKVAIDINPKEGKEVSEDDLKSAAEEAVNFAIWNAKDRGFAINIASNVVIVPDYVEVLDSDNSV